MKLKRRGTAFHIACDDWCQDFANLNSFVGFNENPPNVFACAGADIGRLHLLPLLMIGMSITLLKEKERKQHTF